MEKLQGFMPIFPRAADNALIEAADDLGLNYRTVQKGDFNNACTDVGDLSHLVPVVNFTFKGFEGKLHGADFKITDPEKAYILPAKLLALTAYKLLRKGGEKAKEIKDISGLTHGVGWCAPQQGTCKLTLNVKDGIIQEALVETIG